MSPAYRVMTVCTGNICRSPMAEIVLRQALAAAGLGRDVTVESTAVYSEEQGNPIDPRASRCLVAHGYDGGAKHRARQVTHQDLVDVDLLLPMTARHALILRRLLLEAIEAGEMLEEEVPEVRMWRSFDPAAPAVTETDREDRLDVPDPWYGGPADFEACLATIEAATPHVVKHVSSQVA